MLDRNWLSERLKKFPERTIPAAGLRPAAVLVPLFHVEGQDHLLFTERTGHLHHHAGEISFPGGGRDDQDSDLRMTALRETYEELGIPPEQIEILGRLDDFYSIHGYHVVPFVADIPTPDNLRVDPFEIAQVFSAPLGYFRNPEVHHVEDWQHKGRDYLVDFYRFKDHVIWGLTAAILRQLLEETITATL